jgi:hypothetical protein
VDGQQHLVIIPVMVELSQILKAAIQDIYCTSGDYLMSANSQVGLKLTNQLNEWKANLPACLNLDVDSLDDAEWAYKQKLVLRIRMSRF